MKGEKGERQSERVSERASGEVKELAGVFWQEGAGQLTKVAQAP